MYVLLRMFTFIFVIHYCFIQSGDIISLKMAKMTPSIICCTYVTYVTISITPWMYVILSNISFVFVIHKCCIQSGDIISLKTGENDDFFYLLYICYVRYYFHKVTHEAVLFFFTFINVTYS